MIRNRKRLGDLLIEAGLITTEQLEKALYTQKKTGERLGRTLVTLNYITEEKILELLEVQLGVPRIDLTTIPVNRDLAALIPASLAERHIIVPIRKEGGRLTIAMADPTNFIAIDDVRIASGMEVDSVIATESSIMRTIGQTYGVRDLVEKAVNKLRADEQSGVGLTEIQIADDAPIISIINSLITQAVKERASDIHIEPQDASVRVRYRIDGALREAISFPKHTHAALTSRVKIMSDMDIAEKRIPQDGRIKIMDQGHEIDLRVSSLPTIRGEKIVMRILDKRAVLLDMSKLGFSPANLEMYKDRCNQSYGMILVTGPTGSGKTTTLYSTLSAINSPEKNVITVEEPVEYRLEGINQVQVNQKAGMTFANGLRSILRQDPDIIMVGEIRDMETADIAVRAALTGHLVFSTLHTNDACGAITRLTDMGVEPFLVVSSVLGVVAQRLVRRICPKCKEAYTPEHDSPERIFVGISPEEPVTFYRGAGCHDCAHTGYRGRMAIHEVIAVTPELRVLINRRASGDELAAVARSQGMTSMRQDGIDKAYQGLTTVAEVMKVAYSDE